MTQMGQDHMKLIVVCTCKYALSLAQLDLLVLFSQDLCQLWVALSNEVQDQVSSSISEYPRGSRRQAQRLYQTTKKDTQTESQSLKTSVLWSLFTDQEVKVCF